MWLLYISFSFRAGLLHAFLFFIRLTWWRGLDQWFCDAPRSLDLSHDLLVRLLTFFPYSFHSFLFFLNFCSSSKVSASLFCSLPMRSFPLMIPTESLQMVDCLLTMGAVIGWVHWLGPVLRQPLCQKVSFPKKRCLISCLEGIHLEASRGKSLGAFNIDHTDIKLSPPVFRLKTALVISQTELPLFSSEDKPPVFCWAKARSPPGRDDLGVELLLPQPFHQASALLYPSPSLPIVPATAGNCLALGVHRKRNCVFVFSCLLAHNFIFLGLLMSFTISPSAFRFPEYFGCCLLSFLSLSLRVCILYKLKD